MLTTDPMISALAAAGPHPDHADQLMLFGQFVGSWDITSVWFDREGGAAREVPREWHFGWALEGRAIVDVLRDEHGIGTTVRILHPAERKWTVAWQTTAEPEVYVLTARPRGERIVLEGPSSNGLEEWSFNEITADGFLWRSRVSDDGGVSWFVDQEMRARRRA